MEHEFISLNVFSMIGGGILFLGPGNISLHAVESIGVQSSRHGGFLFADSMYDESLRSTSSAIYESFLDIQNSSFSQIRSIKGVFFHFS